MWEDAEIADLSWRRKARVWKVYVNHDLSSALLPAESGKQPQGPACLGCRYAMRLGEGSRVESSRISFVDRPMLLLFFFPEYDFEHIWLSPEEYADMRVDPALVDFRQSIAEDYPIRCVGGMPAIDSETCAWPGPERNVQYV